MDGLTISFCLSKTKEQGLLKIKKNTKATASQNNKTNLNNQ